MVSGQKVVKEMRTVRYKLLVEYGATESRIQGGVRRYGGDGSVSVCRRGGNDPSYSFQDEGRFRGSFIVVVIDEAIK